AVLVGVGLRLPMVAVLLFAGLVLSSTMGSRLGRWSLALALGLIPLASGAGMASADPFIGWLLALAGGAFFYHDLILAGGAEERWDKVTGESRERRSGALAFLGSLLLSWLFLSRDVPAGPMLLRAALATLTLGLGLAVWGGTPRSRLASGRSLRKLTGVGLASRLLLLLLLGALVGSLFRGPLPPLGDRLVALAEGWKDRIEFGNRRSGRENRPPSSENRKRSPKPFSGESSHPMAGDGLVATSNEFQFLLELEDRGEMPPDLPLYVRTHFATRYEGGKWFSEGENRRLYDASDGRRDQRIVRQPGLEGLRHRIYFAGDGYLSRLPVLQNVVWIGADSLVLGPGESLLGPRYFMDPVTYEAASRPLFVDRIDDMVVPETGPDKSSLALPGGALGHEIRALSRRITESVSLPADKLRALQDYLKNNHRYSLTIENPEGRDPMEQFLFHQSPGHCDFFAASAVLLARGAGLPARLAFGYAVGAADEARPEQVSFYGGDAHSWAEVYCLGQGWAIFEATPPGEGAPGFRVGSPSPDFGRTRFEELIRRAEPPPPVWKNWLDRYRQWLQVSGFRELLPGVLFLIGLVLLGWVWRRRRQRKKNKQDEENGGTGDPLDYFPRYLAEFCRAGRERGFAYYHGQTVLEFLTDLKRGQVVGEEFDPMVSYYYGVRYGGQAVEPHREEGFLEEVAAFRRALADRPFVPRTLRQVQEEQAER
ncbi:MAG: transglutaminase domain-containing protein, partial [Verrucomicrobiota bacterium]